MERTFSRFLSKRMMTELKHNLNFKDGKIAKMNTFHMSKAYRYYSESQKAGQQMIIMFTSMPGQSHSKGYFSLRVKSSPRVNQFSLKINWKGDFMVLADTKNAFLVGQ